MGSKYCLFRTPPLHLNASDLDHIPSEHYQLCLNRLESLVVEFYVGDKLEFDVINAPNVRHIKFIETNVISKTYYAHHLLDQIKEYSSISLTPLPSSTSNGIQI
ncbi:hypothetical protein SAMD00019534_067970 [Acytostelium subglobosum LB1]|uniref:hypothetical protein n=1 Tax=Acytostelium subglobosum LB1 TaxID=1410327 RepID=UPI000644C1B9|nr:hypothetical protein SAMD00019534_067970 [Acytostelium subglobosum LB1]GAM23622.1 hypothetical protein SAMD00019534_067970 [Acytostelium subglobosum LB1]|eukprot:XP_012753363.1 hypothetical protein SAMD00019534_067970 [Acytostelium subglobosum LB1]